MINFTEMVYYFAPKYNKKQLYLFLLCMPNEVTFKENEFDSCNEISSLIDYVYKTEWLVRPYYSIEDEE